MQRFELSDGKSNKFWQVDVQDTDLVVRYGRIGTDGQEKIKSFDSTTQAEKERDKLIAQKTKKGYAPAGDTARAAPPAPNRDKPAPKPAASKPAVKKTARAGVPEVLAHPPWLAPKKASTKKAGPAVVIELEPLPHPESMDWEEGAREEHTRYAPHESRKSVQEFLNRCAEHADKGKSMYAYIDDHWYMRDLVDDDIARALAEAPNHVWRSYTAEYVVGRLNERVLESERIFELAAHFGQPAASKMLAPVVSTRAARFMARGFVGKRTRALGEAWLDKHPETAAVGLIPVALEKKGKDRDAARAALQHLGARGHGPLVQQTAARYGEEAAADMRALLGEDTAAALPDKLPKLPKFLQRDALPPVELTSGGTLAEDEVEALLTMLAFSPLDNPYTGIAAVKAACTDESLAAFALALFQQWQANREPSAEAWMLFAGGLLGDDQLARALTPVIRAWPGAGGHQKAVKGLAVLRAIGSDVAMMMLYGISQKVKFKGIKEQARQMVDAIAQERGLTVAELGDRLVPRLDLDDDGSMRLDFGPRAFTWASMKRSSPLSSTRTISGSSPCPSRARPTTRRWPPPPPSGSRR